MSRDGSVELTWAGDLRSFRLGIDELLALQDKRDAGPQEIANRLRSQGWRVQDVHETLRLGLIGGGMEAKQAQRLVDEQARPGKLASSALIAFAVIVSAIQGDESDPVGKKKEAAVDAPGVQDSPLPPSMAQEPSSTTPPSRSDE
jgi:hypothetical protein